MITCRWISKDSMRIGGKYRLDYSSPVFLFMGLCAPYLKGEGSLDTRRAQVMYRTGHALATLQPYVLQVVDHQGTLKGGSMKKTYDIADEDKTFYGKFLGTKLAETSEGKWVMEIDNSSTILVINPDEAREVSE